LCERARPWAEREITSCVRALARGQSVRTGARPRAEPGGEPGSDGLSKTTFPVCT
jgi:hypothetical protein